MRFTPPNGTPKATQRPRLRQTLKLVKRVYSLERLQILGDSPRHVFVYFRPPSPLRHLFVHFRPRLRLKAPTRLARDVPRVHFREFVVYFSFLFR